VHTTILRPFNIYGANQNDKFLIPTILKQVFDERQKEIEVLDLTPRRDYLFLDDLVTAIVMLFQKNQNGIYNIGSGYSMTVRDIIEAILHVSGINKKYISKETSRKNEIPDVVADISKIKAATGWKPAYGFKEGVAEIIKREGLK
jgi:nucleoside-diphosphate-sugar epimerase